MEHHIHIHINNNQDRKVLKKLKKIMTGQEELKATVDQLTEKVDGIATAIATEGAEVRAAITELNETVASLEDQLANGITPEGVAEIKGKIEAAVNRLDQAQVELVNFVTPAEPPVEPTDPSEE